jgi:hygromycin-B 4-O-kinase
MQSDDAHTDALYPARVAAFLAQQFGGEIADLERIGHGQWSKTFSFRSDGADYIARFSGFDEDFHKDRLAMAYASPHLPIPRILKIGEGLGGYYAISNRMSGDFIETLDSDGMRRLLPSFFAMLDAVRNADLSSTRGYGVWGGDGNAPHPTWRAGLLDIADDRPTKRAHGWREPLAESPTGNAAFEEAFACLESLIGACPEERYLIHSDLLYYNVLVANDRISAVLDWGSGMYGDFLWDVAWFTFWQPWYSGWRDVDFKLEAARHYASIGLEVPSMAERLRCYELCIGLDGMAYQAFKRRFSELEWTASRVREVVHAHEGG